MSDPVVQNAFRELEILTECTCSGPRHQPDCPSYWREDVDTLRAAIARLTAVADAARALVKRMDECAGFIDGDEEADRLLFALRHAVREGWET